MRVVGQGRPIHVRPVLAMGQSVEVPIGHHAGCHCQPTIASRMGTASTYLTRRFLFIYLPRAQDCNGEHAGSFKGLRDFLRDRSTLFLSKGILDGEQKPRDHQRHFDET